jgi:hypothetical protein
MDNVIFSPVTCDGQTFEFKAIVQRFGYTYRVSVSIDETVIQFEPDEKGNFRALSPASQFELPHYNRTLIEQIAQTITLMTSPH